MSRQKSPEPNAESSAAVTTTAKEADVFPGSPSKRDPRPILVRSALGLAAAALMLVASGLPIWRADFSAAQYPKGLGLAAHGNRVEGDLSEINELSHYIGMPPFNFVGLPEMRLWPLVILVGTAVGVLAVVTRRRWLRRLACTAVWLIPIAALADVQFRLWQVGHSLDPTSPIRVTPFTPHVVGPTTLMNFTLVAYPGMALLLIAVAAALVTSTPFVVRRLTQTAGAKTSGAKTSGAESTGAESTGTKTTGAESAGSRSGEAETSDSELNVR